MTLIDHMRGLVADGKMDWSQLDRVERTDLIGHYMAERREEAQDIIFDACPSIGMKFGQLLVNVEYDAIDFVQDITRLLVTYADKYMQDTLADLFESAVYEERQAKADSARAA